MIHPSQGWCPYGSMRKSPRASSPASPSAGRTCGTTRSDYSFRQRLVSEPACVEEMMRGGGGCRKTFAGRPGAGRGPQSEITLTPRTASTTWGTGTGSHRVRKSHQAPVINEALIWQGQAMKEQMGRSSPWWGSGRVMGRGQLKAVLPAAPGSLQTPHGRGEGPELQTYWAEQENYIYLYKHVIVTYLKDVTAARSRGAARQSHQLLPVPCAKLGHRETAATHRGSFTTASATHAQTSPSRKNRRLIAPAANRTARQSPPPLSSPASPSSLSWAQPLALPSKTALGLVGSTNKFY